MELDVRTRQDWRKWLEKNHASEQEVWLMYYKKPSGKERIPYGDAVEEALCFGWIDGRIKKINEDYYIQRFTPRRPGSRWSALNVTRVTKLIKEGLMRPAGLKAFEETLSKPGLIYDNVRLIGDYIPEDLKLALERNKPAQENFMNFPESARNLYVRWLNDAKKSETRLRRIEKIVVQSEKNIRPGI